MELRHSCYFGEFYHENEYMLLSDVAFEAVEHVVDLKGAPIRPGRVHGVVPAGTRLSIERIDFPDETALVRRMVLGPRYSPWVVVRPEPGQLAKSVPQGPFVLVLSSELVDGKAFTEALLRHLAPEGQVTTWLAARRPRTRTAILHKEVLAGMSTEEALAAAGMPLRWIRERGADVAWYGPGGHEIRINAGRVEQVLPARADNASGPAPTGL
jgi:hypothetical protein